MRLFGIEDENEFREFVRTPFDAKHEEATLEQWLDANPQGIVEDGELLIVGRQVTTNLGKYIDILALDRAGDTVVVELKRGRTPRDVVAQALEYASFVERLSADQLEELLQKYSTDESLILADYHRRHFKLGDDEAVSFNKQQRLVIVGQQISNEVRQTSVFLGKKGIPVTCIEFSFFETADGKRLISQDTVVDSPLTSGTSVTTASAPKTDKVRFLASLDGYGRPIFEALFDLASQKELPIIWGTKGFSLNGVRDGAPAAILFGYPPETVYGQSIYTGIRGPKGGLLRKIEADSDLENQLVADLLATNLFQGAGNEFKSIIDRPWTQQEIQALVDWVKSLATTVEDYQPSSDSSSGSGT